MKQFAFAILTVLVLAMVSCKKEYQNIASYDAQSIQDYIAANRLTMTAGDSGIYYQVITPGTTGKVLADSDRVFYSYTVKTLDGKFVSADTLLNRVPNYIGINTFGYSYYNSTQASVVTSAYTLPAGLQFGIKKYLQKRNGVIRLLIPSKQAYGVSGFTSPDGLIKFGGNESLDYTVYLYNVNSQVAYDTVQIRNYIKKNNLTGFRKSPTGLYYKIVDAGSGIDQIYNTSTVTVTYTKRLLLSQTEIETKSLDAALLSSYISGWQEGLTHINSGGKIRLLIPSDYAYGALAESATTTSGTYKTPPNSILDYDVNVTAVTN
ncbi:MAG: hypothetical protein EOP41_06000 [Sphingobacteriaceae bacterium]|nr:MAG: hypothetical protein EOP41_06000 [Sphingobacteriaceae bacterium]